MFGKFNFPLKAGLIALAGFFAAPAHATGFLSPGIYLDQRPQLCSVAEGPVHVAGTIRFDVSHLNTTTEIDPAGASPSVTIGIYQGGVLVNSVPATLNGKIFEADIAVAPGTVGCFDIIAEMSYNLDPVGDLEANGDSKWQISSSASEGLRDGLDNDICFGKADCTGNPEHVVTTYDTEKTCTLIATPIGSAPQIDCTIVVDHPTAFPATGFQIADKMTLNGQVLSGATFTTTASAGAVVNGCGENMLPDQGYAGMLTAPIPMSMGYGCTVTVAPNTTQTTLHTSILLPVGTKGVVSNCAYSMSGLPHIPDALLLSARSCAEVVVGDKPHPHDPIKPVACEAFTTEVTCDEVSGKPVVTLKNKLSNIFNPSQVKITSQTNGVTVQQSKANPMQILLSGAQAGDTVLLMTDALAKGKGSQPGLDLCCEGPIKVEIPKGFTCEAKAKLEVSKTCDTDVKTTVGANAECEITVHYEGPKPTAANPIVVTEAVTGSPWAFTTTPLSSDNWSCPAVPNATPFTCTIDGAAEPTANWANWTSTIIVQMKAGVAFENCASATSGGLAGKACWSTETPELTVQKTADQDKCMVGQPCTFTIAVTNSSTTTAYEGPITLGDQITAVVPPVLTSMGSFTTITPPLCPLADLNSGACSGNVTMAPGAVQSYTVTWIPPAFTAGADADAVVATNCVDLAWLGSGTRDPNYDAKPEPVRSCADVTLLPPDLHIVKTGPEKCQPGQPCDYQVTISTTNQPFNGPAVLMDDAPSGFVITAITPTPPGCGANLPANPLICVVPVSLNAGASVTYTLSIEPLAGPTSGEPMLGENCAHLLSSPEGSSPADYSYSGAGMGTVSDELSGLLENSTELGKSCVPVNWVVEPANITVEKRFLQAECSVGGACDFELVITNQSAVQSYVGTVALQDNMTPAGYQVTGMTPALCSPVPTTAPFDCAANVNLAPGQTQIVTITGFVPFGVIAAGTSAMAKNCANAAPVAQGSIAPWPANLFDTTKTTCAETTVCGFACHMNETEAGKLSVEKILLNPETCVPGGICTYGITVTNTSTTPMFSPLTLLEALPASGTMVAVRNLPWSCGPKASGLSCVHPPITMNPGDTTSFEIDVAIGAGFAGTEITNCVGFETAAAQNAAMRQVSPDPMLQLLEGGSEQGLVEYLQQRGISAEGAARMAPAFVVKANGAAELGSGQQSCVSKTLSAPLDGAKVTPASAPALSVTKTSTGPCTVNEAAQTYTCDYDLTVTNAGGDFAGPMVLGDAFDAGMVTNATGSGAGWSCTTANDAASCINGNLSLAAGASEAVTISVTVKGLPNGGTFENCAAIGASDDPTQQAMIVQTALTLMGVDVGAIDGQPGKRTRAGVVDLQDQLGLEPTGEIDDALLTALGVPMAGGAAPSCVTVDLPPMPKPRLICDKATTVNEGGACACRYKNMYQADDQSCGCVKGFNFVAGEGCIKRKVKDPVKDPVKPKGVKCDVKTTVLRNGVCECREEGMVRRNATSCARQKVKQELKICPNGLPEIPGIGCVDIKIGGGGGKKDDDNKCSKFDKDGTCCTDPGAFQEECR